ncbi:MAG TPA: NAD(P)-dependent oxidoreductase, partial [Candidatus Limnocylindrales bacterium]|nr:NAD(P)-dependent oxidoreductase [Candidatus Limnocylindrales bacterium]
MADKHTVYVTEPDVIDMQALARLLLEPDYVLQAGAVTFESADPEAVKTLVIRSETIIRDDIKQYFPAVQSVVRIGTGLDNVDLAYCSAAGIHVFNAPGANADAVAEYVVAVVLAARRRLHLLSESDVQSWNRFKFSGHGIGGRSVGIIGYGNIGRLLHQKLQGLGCRRFMIYDPYVSEEQATAAGVELVPL